MPAIGLESNRFGERLRFREYSLPYSEKEDLIKAAGIIVYVSAGIRSWPNFSVGVSKTHLAQALGQQTCRAGYNVLFIKASRLLSNLGGSRVDDAWEKRLAHYLKANLLILDDFAMKEFTKTQAEDLYDLIDRRHHSSSMIVAANRAPKDWYPLFTNTVIAESALDRLVSCTHVITLPGRSYRALLRPNKDLDKEVATV